MVRPGLTRTVIPVRVIEMYLRGKLNHPAHCEDVVVVTDDYAAVLDGATDKSGYRYTYSGHAVSSGRFAAEVAADAIRGLPAGIDASTGLELVRTALATALSAQRPDLAPQERPSASVVLYSAVRREVWRLGDCGFALDGVPHPGGKFVDELTSHLRAAARIAIRATGQSPDADGDAGREVILPFLRLQGALAHQPGPYGYGVLDGRPFRAEHLEVVPVPAGVSEVVLASDGYPALGSTLADAEHDLAAALAEDPTCEDRLRSTKGLAPGQASFDDRAWLRLSV